MRWLCYGLRLHRRRQLQDRSALSFAQLRDADDFSIGELQRVMMCVWLIYIDLPKARDLLFKTAMPHEGE
jgi:hypothetical protein